MPLTPYHFGPSGLVGLVFHRWLDVPVFVLANVIVDLEVLTIRLLQLGAPRHRYVHTLLVGGLVGALWGLVAYPLRGIFARGMRLLGLPYQPGRMKMIVSGVLGLWLHVLIDGLYHFDVKLFWPSRSIWLWRCVQRYLDQHQIERICLGLLVAAVVVYVGTVLWYRRRWWLARRIR